MNLLRYEHYSLHTNASNQEVIPKVPCYFSSYFLALPVFPVCLATSLTACLNEFWPDISALSLLSPLRSEALQPHTSSVQYPNPDWHLFKKRAAQICQLWWHLKLVSRLLLSSKSFVISSLCCPSLHFLFVTMDSFAESSVRYFVKWKAVASHLALACLWITRYCDTFMVDISSLPSLSPWIYTNHSVVEAPTFWLPQYQLTKDTH